MLGTKLANRYEIIREIGRGGMGVVYLAHDPFLEREVAVKVVMPDIVTPETIERFKREARVVAKMDHRSIVSVYDTGEDQGSLFFVMPFVSGTNLRTLLRNQSVSLGELVDIGAQVASALNYSHSRGIIHRDIKPENIMVERERSEEIRVRVMDFGLAVAPEQHRLTGTATVVGTMIYMSPEQVTGKQIDSKSDIYSLGTVLYECVTGQPPFSGEMQALVYRISNEIPLPPRALQPQLDDDLEELLLRCLEKDPAKRPSGRELFEKLSRYRTHLIDSGKYITMLPTATALSIHYKKAVARPFVGRDKEFAELQRRLNAALAGECQLVFIGGEAGIGKTRLLEELETLAKARSIQLLHGHFAEIDRALPYHAYCETIQEYFRNRSSLAPPADFSDLAADLSSLFPVLGEVKELSPSGETAQSHTERSIKRFEDRTYIFELLAKTITRMAGGNPLILLLEELHAADVSVEGLDYIVRRLALTPTLIVGTYRTTDIDKRHPVHKMISSFKRDKQFAALQLGPLTPSGHREFLEKLMGGAGIEDTLASKFYEATEGNPYFTNELVRSLIDSGGIVKDNTGVYKLSSETALSIEELPATIQQTIEERLARLPAEQLELLSTASILGKRFDFNDLVLMAPEKTNLENNLEQLLISGFIEEDRQSHGLHFSFSSGVLRDFLYGSIPRLRRRMLHRKYAEELEKRNEGRLERVSDLLFEHYSGADIPEKVIQFGFLLAQKSLESWSPEDTIGILKTVLDFLEYAGDENSSKKAESKVLLASAHRMRGDVEAALRECEEAVRIFEQSAEGSKALEAITIAANTAWQARKVEETRHWVERGIVSANKQNDEAALRNFLSLGATIANLRSDYSKARQYLDELEKLQPRKVEPVEKITEGGTLTVAISSQFQTRHPVNTTLLEEDEVLSNVFETIVDTDEQGTLLPHLCERWESLNEGAMFLFVLRKEVTLHDGTRLTAKEVKKSMENAVRSCQHALPPGLAAIRDAAEYQHGTAQEITGILALSDNILQIHLRDRIAIYPALLTDSRTSIVFPSEGGVLLGTGPFKLTALKSEHVIVEKNKNYWKGKSPHLDTIRFEVAGSLADMANGFRSGKFDLIRELDPRDLDLILRDRSLHATVVEAPMKNVCFFLFNQSSPVCSKPQFRKALAGIIHTKDLVRSTLGRHGQPAEGFLPPGIFGHDPGRRRYPISDERARELIVASGISTPVALRIAVNPVTRSRYAVLLDAVFRIWGELGIEVNSQTPTTESYLKTLTDNKEIDLLLTRWIGDYDDPDSLTYSLFHSEIGVFRNYCSSKELDDVMAQPRLEKNFEKRQTLYRKIENSLLESASLCPLFHDVHYRLASPKVHGLALSSSPPFVNYEELTKEEKLEPVRFSTVDRGALRIPVKSSVPTLDPGLSFTLDRSFIGTMVFEPLTRAAEGARIIPWLAESFQAEEDGRRFRFRLRDGVRFHDGRRLTSRDVRYSFERILANPEFKLALYLSGIRGAENVLQGKSRELEGFRILSAQEFLLELEKPLSFFPAVVSHPSFVIIPEGLEDFSGNWRQGVVGTGPFRIVSFEWNRTFKLEANPFYWRPGLPKAEALEFMIGVSPGDMLSGFRSGKFSLAYLLETAQLESLLQEPQFMNRYKEIAALNTTYISFNQKEGIFSDEKARKIVATSLDVERLVRRNRRFAAPARTLIPPALLGYEPERPMYYSSGNKLDETEIAVALSTAAQQQYGNLTQEILGVLNNLGLQLRITEVPAEKLVPEMLVQHDLFLQTWWADFPDADGIVYPLLHSTEGFTGGGMNCPEIDRLIEQARRETDPDVRHSLYRRIEDEIREHAPVIPLLHDQFQCFARPEVEGLELNYFYPIIPFENLSIRR
jgi:ABC-type transport system substrate-binding protein